MYLVERYHRRLQQCEHLVKAQPAMRLCIVRQILAVEELHYYICRAVFLKIVAHIHDIRLAYKLCKYLGLVKKALLALAERRFIGLICRDDGERPRAGHAAGHIIFLDRDLAVELEVIAHVGYAEAARTESASDNIPAVENTVHRQLMRLVRRIHAAPAHRTYVAGVLDIRHAVRAKEYFSHRFSPKYHF